MPLSKLDPVAALVIIDMQKGIVGLPAVHPMAGIIANVAALAKAFRARGLPVVLVNVTERPPGRTEFAMNFNPPPDWDELIPELDRQPGDYTVTKANVGAFYGTALERILRWRGATQIFLCGVATSIGVEATAREAYDHGYNVVLATDATTDLDAENYRHAVEKIFPRIGERAATEEVLAALK